MSGPEREDLGTDATIDVSGTGSGPGQVPSPPVLPDATAVEAGARVRRNKRPDPLQRGAIVGRYVMLEELGAGGMGVVYAAYDPELNRRVALKLVRPGPSGSSGPSRYQREAQALARLSHPNVVSIYDVGTLDEHVFLAMELVEGKTLQEWMKVPKRPWREIVNVFAAAGRGLAAAHAAGIVHRDFKPNNVVVGDDGRVRVLDFGLARAGGQRDPDEPVTATRPSVPDSLDLQLTAAGSVLGTPIYMSPEAYRSEVVTDAGDQFSFCVAFYEGLYGQRPFDHAFEATLPPIAAPPSDTKVPAWVRKIVIRGLAAKPEDRWPSMNELLAALADDPAIKRRKWLIGAGVVAVVAGAAVVGTQWRAAAPPNTDPCANAAPLAGTWDAAVRSRVHAAFVASKAGTAEASFTHAAAALDESAGNWLTARRGACTETRERHAVPEAMLLLRLACLDRQREDLAALVALFEHPDPDIVEQSAQAVRGLAGPALCANPRSLTYVDPPPAASASRVTELRKGLSAAGALLLAGKEKEAGTRLEALVAEARTLGYAPLLAEALYLLGRQKLDDFDAAIAHLDEAELVAVTARADTVAARAAAIRLVEGIIAGRPDDILDSWSRRANAWVSRDGDLEAEFGFEESLGMLAEHHGDHVGAEAHYKKAIELGTREFGDASARVFGIQATLAFTLVQLGRYEDATAMLGPAIERFEKAYGSTSVRLRDALDSYGLALAMIGRYPEARKALERALAMGADDDLAHGALLCDLARVQLGEGKIADAIASGERGVALIKSLHVEKANLAINEDPLAAAYAAAGRHQEALTQSRECLEEFKKARNEGLDTVACLAIEGAALIDLDRATEALPVLERAFALQSGHPGAPGVLANLEYQLARALVGTAGDRGRAKELATRAREELVKYPFQKHLLEELDAWRSVIGL